MSWTPGNFDHHSVRVPCMDVMPIAHRSFDHGYGSVSKGNHSMDGPYLRNTHSVFVVQGTCFLSKGKPVVLLRSIHGPEILKAVPLGSGVVHWPDGREVPGTCPDPSGRIGETVVAHRNSLPDGQFLFKPAPKGGTLKKDTPSQTNS